MVKAAKQTFDNVVFCLQGGGALGAYQIGIMQALHEAGYRPHWLVGTSIGAINTAIYAGNAEKDRLDKLDGFWQCIARINPFDRLFNSQEYNAKRFHNFCSAQRALWFGQPHFFYPRIPPLLPWASEELDKLSFYDTAPLKETLERFVDFDRVNHKSIRLSVGAVEVESGCMVYFDSKNIRLSPEHIMASGALPPGFPAVEIEGKSYWDGGLSSNTPLGYVLEDDDAHSRLCFMAHLFDSQGVHPTNLDEVLKRKKDIEFSSRYKEVLKLREEIHSLKYQIHHLSNALPKELLSKGLLKECRYSGWNHKAALVRFLYRADEAELSSKDYAFSLANIKRHKGVGYQTAQKACINPVWHKPLPAAHGIRLYEIPHVSQDAF